MNQPERLRTPSPIFFDHLDPQLQREIVAFNRAGKIRPQFFPVATAQLVEVERLLSRKPFQSSRSRCTLRSNFSRARS